VAKATLVNDLRALVSKATLVEPNGSTGGIRHPLLAWHHTHAGERVGVHWWHSPR